VSGTVVWRNLNNDLHRMSGPAIETPTLRQYVQNNKLHRIDGPAVEVVNEDGVWGGSYYWKGILVPPELWDQRFEIPIRDVLKWPNAEMRRCLIEMRGWDRFIKDSKAEVIHEDKEREAILYRIPLPKINDQRFEETEAITVIRVTDSTAMPDGTRRKYFLEVPPNMKTCLEALAWTFEMEPKQYVLEVET